MDESAVTVWNGVVKEPVWPTLDPGIRVMGDVDAAQLWQPFEFYEAGHHCLDVMNPLSSDLLDQVVDLVNPADGQRVLDIATGHGSFLLRCARRAAIEAEGVDLSPWVLNRAAQRVQQAGCADRVAFTLGSGSATSPDPVWDVVCGLGMSWIWGGFEGSATELMSRSKPGGTVVFGDIHLRDIDDPTDAFPELGKQLTIDQQGDLLTAAGLTDLVQLHTSRQDWARYDNEVHAATVAWTKDHPGRDYVERQDEWMQRRHIVDKAGWAVWVGTKQA